MRGARALGSGVGESLAPAVTSGVTCSYCLLRAAIFFMCKMA